MMILDSGLLFWATLYIGRRRGCDDDSNDAIISSYKRRSTADPRTTVWSNHAIFVGDRPQ